MGMKIKVLIGVIVIVGLAGIFLAMGGDEATYEESLPASLMGETKPVPETIDAKPIPEGPAKAVAAVDVKVGDTFGGFTVTSIERGWDGVHPSLINFAGEATISGRVTYEYDEVFDTHCFEVDSVSAVEIPRFKDDYRNPWFCFLNEVPGSENGALKDKDVTIVIKDYYLDRREGEMVDSATFLRFVE